jgi:membrane protein implicated in regulation of membrane protease activity
MLLDLLIGILLLLFVVFLGVVLLCAWLALPLSDVLNRLFRLVGLAGPSPESRTPGSRAAGVVADPFSLRPGDARGRGKVFAGGELWSAYCPAELASSLREGDAVEVVYNEDLSVSVLHKN